VLGIEGDYLLAQGFSAPENRDEKFRIELATGRAVDAPYR
jgi:hypothetical protein